MNTSGTTITNWHAPLSAGCAAAGVTGMYAAVWNLVLACRDLCHPDSYITVIHAGDGLEVQLAPVDAEATSALRSIASGDSGDSRWVLAASGVRALTDPQNPWFDVCVDESGATVAMRFLGDDGAADTWARDILTPLTVLDRVRVEDFDGDLVPLTRLTDNAWAAEGDGDCPRYVIVGGVPRIIAQGDDSRRDPTKSATVLVLGDDPGDLDVLPWDGAFLCSPRNEGARRVAADRAHDLFVGKTRDMLRDKFSDDMIIPFRELGALGDMVDVVSVTLPLRGHGGDARLVVRPTFPGMTFVSPGFSVTCRPILDALAGTELECLARAPRYLPLTLPAERGVDPDEVFGDCLMDLVVACPIGADFPVELLTLTGQWTPRAVVQAFGMRVWDERDVHEAAARLRREARMTDLPLVFRDVDAGSEVEYMDMSGSAVLNVAEMSIPAGTPAFTPPSGALYDYPVVQVLVSAGLACSMSATLADACGFVTFDDEDALIEAAMVDYPGVDAAMVRDMVRFTLDLSCIGILSGLEDHVDGDCRLGRLLRARDGLPVLGLRTTPDGAREIVAELAREIGADECAAREKLAEMGYFDYWRTREVINSLVAQASGRS